ALEQRGEWLLVFPFGMIGRECLHAVDCEGKLEIDWLLGPQGAVVVEGGDALGGWHEVGRALFRHAFDETHDGIPGCRVVPRRQRVLSKAGNCQRYSDQYDGRD